MTDNFADYPKSIAEIRADREPQGAAIWSCRDALIAALRDIDSGKLDNPHEIAIIVSTRHEDGHTHLDTYQRCESTHSLLGIYAAATHQVLRD